MAKQNFKADMVMEGISDYVKDLFEKIPDEWKVDIASHICFEAAIWGSNNVAEGVGMLEITKMDYFSTSMEIMEQELNEE